MISWTQKQIALLQLETQTKAITLALTRVNQELSLDSNAEAYRLRAALQIQLEGLKNAKKDVEKTNTKRERPWSKLMLLMYDWATRDRFKLD